MSRSLNIVVVLLLSVYTLRSQLPDTELWLFKIETTKTGQVLEDPLNITNRAGYDNQPSFSGDGKKLYYVSIREDRQADLYGYDLEKKKTGQLTKTQMSEYSPGEAPDGKLLASVVVESDSTQCIHFVDPQNGLHEKKLEPDSVGYYTFLNADTVVYYKLTEPHSLRYLVINTHEDKWLGNSPLRAFKAVNRHRLLFGLKDSSGVTFYIYDFLLQKAERYAVYPSLNEDFIWHPVWGLVKSEGARLLHFDEQKREWSLLFDLSVFNLKKITRFDFDTKNKYLVVTENL